MRSAALLLVALLAPLPAAAQWRVAPDKPTEVCETSRAEPVARPPTYAGEAPWGVVYDIPKPVCREVPSTTARSYHLLSGVMIDSQQRLPVGTACDARRVVIAGVTWCQVAGSALWAVAVQ